MALEYNINFTNKRNKEVFILTISDLAGLSCELFMRLKTDRRNGFKHNRKNKPTVIFYAKQSQMTIRYYLKHRIPNMHHQFYLKKCTE